MTYRLTDEAKADFRDIEDYLVGQGGTLLARHVRRKIREALVFLSDTPGAGHRREDLTSRPLKFWPVFSYLIVYAPDVKPLTIVRVLHASRDIETIFQEKPPTA